MNWNSFLKDSRAKFPKDSHGLFSASNYHWLNYPIEKMLKIKAESATDIGTKMHHLACELISMKQLLPDVPKTLNMYVNDAILLNMTPEKQLYFSDDFKGTADAIVVDSDDVLRIHDLKTGVTKASLHQLEIYAALFCLDFGCVPSDFTDIELRIYQNNEIITGHPGVDVIVPIMDKMVTFDRISRKMGDDNHG